MKKLIEYWKKLEFWQKGVILGFVLFLLYALIVIATSWNPPSVYCAGPCSEFDYTSWREFAVYNKIGFLGNLIFGKGNFLVSAVASALIISFAIFGIGFKIGGLAKEYYQKGFIIGFWLPIVPIILISLDVLGQPSYGEQTQKLIVPFLMLTPLPFAGFGALVGFVYGWLKKLVVK